MAEKEGEKNGLCGRGEGRKRGSKWLKEKRGGGGCVCVLGGVLPHRG